MARGLVIIKDYQGNKLTNKDLILESDVSLGISNEYQALLSGGGSGALSAVIASVNSPISAGFKQQGFQVWKQTNPIELKLSVSLHMITSGRNDVVKPVEGIISYSVPSLMDNGWGLQPPGPNLISVLGDKGKELGEKVGFLQEAKGWVTISIGSYINLSQCVIKNAIPTYNLQEDSDGYPISCKLDLDISTMDIANAQMISNLSS